MVGKPLFEPDRDSGWRKIELTAMEPIRTKRRPIARPPSSKLKHLDGDLLCLVFSFLDLVDLAHCSLVCKKWSGIVNKSKLLEALVYDKWRQHKENKSWSECLEEMALERHRLALENSPVRVDHWRVHSVGDLHQRYRKLEARLVEVVNSRERGIPVITFAVTTQILGSQALKVDQCRKKMGLLLTGVGDKVMRLWSLETYKCLGEYPIPDKKPLVDFDFDESKIVGLVGTHICIWRRNRIRSTFPMREDTFPKGLCMRYCDPDAVVGCIDGTARIFDMYSQRCSQVVKMHAGPVTCLCMSDDQWILTGSSYGSVAVSCVSSAQRITEFRLTQPAGIRSVCFKPSSSHMLFAGSTDGYVFCWDVRSGRRLWETKVSPNVVYSMHHLRNDTSSLVVGGIDGVLRVLNQDTGEVVSKFVSEGNLLSSSRSQQVIGSGTVQQLTGRRLSPEASIDGIPRSNRPPITSVAVGMKNIITAHNNKYIRIWKFD